MGSDVDCVSNSCGVQSDLDYFSDADSVCSSGGLLSSCSSRPQTPPNFICDRCRLLHAGSEKSDSEVEEERRQTESACAQFVMDGDYTCNCGDVDNHHVTRRRSHRRRHRVAGSDVTLPTFTNVFRGVTSSAVAPNLLHSSANSASSPSLSTLTDSDPVSSHSSAATTSNSVRLTRAASDDVTELDSANWFLSSDACSSDDAASGPPKESASSASLASRPEVNTAETSACCSAPQQPLGVIFMTECAICLESYKIGATLCGLPCGHAFHQQCILGWLQRDNHCCPVCRWPPYKAKPCSLHAHID